MSHAFATQQPEITLASIQAAQQRIGPHVRRTPVLQDEFLDAAAGAQLFFKCENLQHGGAFKARGATNAIFALPNARLQAGVVTHSSGNHGTAVARAARLRGVAARIVMPHDCSPAKIAAVRAYGGEVLFCEPTLAAREAMAAEIVKRSGAAFIHPYDDPLVIAGQGTIALELLEQVPELDWLLLPVGGGGLASGVALAARSIRPELRLLAVEPALADDAQRSFRSGVLEGARAPLTVADGLRGALSARTHALLRQHYDDVITVSEQDIVRAMRALWLHLRMIIEASSAVPYAALLERPQALQGSRIGLILTGGNVDLKSLPWERGPER
jgi:threonine dehydratase